MPPHAPYNPRREFIGIFNQSYEPPAKPEHYFATEHRQKTLARLRRQYDETIAYVDAEFGRFYDLLVEQNLLDNLCLVVTSDHGELLERGINGHNTPALYEPITQIPLLISYPGQTQRHDVHTLSSSVDLLPTLLERAGVGLPTLLEGFVLPNAKNPAASDDRRVFVVEAKTSPKLGKLVSATLALFYKQFKLVYYSGYPGLDQIFELYDIAEDPEELTNLYSPTDSLSQLLQEDLLIELSKHQP
jgi:arylsulfatase A-like enzyme